MRGADCGPCSQLNVDLAAEAGVDRSLLGSIVAGPELLEPPLDDVWRHASRVGRGDPSDPEVVDRLRSSLGDAAFAELGVLIAGTRLYPTLKSALGVAESCSVLRVRP